MCRKREPRGSYVITVQNRTVQYVKNTNMTIYGYTILYVTIYNSKHEEIRRHWKSKTKM